MARFLQDLLGAKEPQFSTAVHNLERATGHAGVDVRLIGDVIARGHDVMRQLNLDPADTTVAELYAALQAHGGDEALFADTHFVGLVFNGQVVSLNADDVKDNRTRHFDQRAMSGMRSSLEHELVDRYYQHPRTDDRVVAEFAADAGLELLLTQTTTDTQTEKEQSMNNQPYILSIGDIFSDAFIKLRDDTARIDTDPDGSKRLSFPYGSKPAYDHADIIKSVGPSPNAAVSLSRLGLNVSLMAWLGDDQPGVEALQHLKEEGVDTSMMVTEAGKKSSYWYVLWYQSDRTMLVKSEDYSYEWHAPAHEPDWIYLSYIGEDSWPLHEALVAYLEAHPNVKLVFQPGTYHFGWGTEKLAGIYQHTHLVVMNREEAMQITGKAHESLKELADGLHALGPKIAVITDGPNGSYASYDDKLVTIPNYPDPAPPLDRTGAGDAFASTIVAALALGESMDTALTWAPINSMNVVQKLGAQAGLLRRNEVNRYLHTAPADYRVTEMQ